MAINSLQLPSAQAITPNVDWTPLGQLGQVYKKAQNEQKLSDLGSGLADGSLDYRTAAAQTASMGDIQHTLQFLALDEQKKKQAQELAASEKFRGGLSTLYGADPTPAVPTTNPMPIPGAPVNVPAAAPAMALTRAPVEPSARVWGDKEAEAAGLYEPSKPTVVAQANIAPQPTAASVSNTPIPNGMTPRALKLISASSDPRLPQGDRDVAKTLLTAELDNSKATSDMKEWAFAKSQDPNTPDYTTWARANKAAGKTEVNVDTKGQNAFAKTSNEGIAKRFEKLSEEGDQGAADLALVGQLRDLGQVIKTGAPAAIQGALANYGIKVGQNVGAVEAYGSIIDKLTPQQRIPGSGATSDYEGKMFKNSLPKLMNTPEGNTIIEGTLAALAQHKIDRARIAEQGIVGDLTPKETIKALRDLPSPYANFSAFQKSGFKADPNAAPAVTPQAAPQQAAPPVQGARQAPDGKFYVPDPDRPGKYLEVTQ